MILVFLCLPYFTERNKCPLGPFISSQMARFHSFIWPSNIPRRVCAASSSPVHLSADTWVAVTWNRVTQQKLLFSYPVAVLPLLLPNRTLMLLRMTLCLEQKLLFFTIFEASHCKQDFSGGYRESLTFPTWTRCLPSSGLSLGAQRLWLGRKHTSCKFEEKDKIILEILVLTSSSHRTGARNHLSPDRVSQDGDELLYCLRFSQCSFLLYSARFSR